MVTNHSTTVPTFKFRDVIFKFENVTAIEPYFYDYRMAVLVKITYI